MIFVILMEKIDKSSGRKTNAKNEIIKNLSVLKYI